ncbi:hypothetical protein L6164_012546 [Bauhinia variegata]|uniref:Uncharacterized protein n=1 Tax=Bauhinia variegata TaxID=167791 RepID=A0ACB9PAB5_BAUVA|nr:hypothetical protein L6164_012546 [Bauhinia variegata]
MPHDAERNLGHVQWQSIRIAVKPTVCPDEPRRQTHGQRRTQSRQMNEPERREPEGFGQTVVLVARTEEGDYGERKGKWDGHAGG